MKSKKLVLTTGDPVCGICPHMGQASCQIRYSSEDVRVALRTPACNENSSDKWEHVLTRAVQAIQEMGHPFDERGGGLVSEKLEAKAVMPLCSQNPV